MRWDILSNVIRQLALVLLGAWAAALPCEAQTPISPLWVTVYFNERPPLTMVAGQTGILVDLTKAVLTEAGIRARFIELPAIRILDLLRTGDPDALGIGEFLTPEGETWDRYSIPLYQEHPIVALVNARAAASIGNPVRLEVLLSSGLTLGQMQGRSFGPSVDAKIRTQGLTPVETAVEIPQLLKMVQAGRMDYTFLSEEEARYLLKQDPALTPGLILTRLTDPPPGNLWFFLYPKEFDPALATRIDAAIERVRASTRYRELTAAE
jgi:ABC-type amino acid transport substrate-binding protein